MADRCPRPGVREAATWFREGIVEADIPRLLFFVGGPGAGKSHALSDVVEGFEEVDAIEDGLAHRSYDYALEGARVRVVNDATISTGTSAHALADDIANCVNDGQHLVACVNRGVLVDESNKISAPTDAGQRLVLHLAGNRRAESEELELDTASNNFLSAGVVRQQGLVAAEVVVVYADMCSLFETRPSSSIKTVPPSPPVAQVQPYAVRKLASRTSMTEPQMPPAGELLVAIVERLAQDLPADVSHNPVAANIQSLQNASARSALLTVLRCGEIVTGGRMTFREAWGSFSRAIVGDLTAHVAAGEARDRVEGLAPDSDDPRARWEALRRLASLRTSQAIFGADLNPRGTTDPVTFFTSRVDPLLDARQEGFRQAHRRPGGPPLFWTRSRAW